MKIIKNNFIPFPGYKYCNLFGVLFTRPKANIKEIDLNHESIHSELWKELWYIGFILLYLIEWIYNIFKYKNFDLAYKNLKFEKEAYLNENNLDYLKTRKKFAWNKL